MSDSTLALVSKYLDSDEIRDIVVKLSKNLFTSHEELVTFCDLVGQVDTKTVTKIYPRILEFTQQLLTSQDEDAFPDFLRVAEKLPQLYDDAIALVYEYLANSVLQSLYKFTPEVKKLMVKYMIVESEDAVPTEDPNTEHMTYLLSFLEYVYAREELDFSQLDYTVVFLLAIENEEVSSIVNRILRWRISMITKNSNDTSVIWDIIFTLEASGNPTHVSHALTLWLRYLNNPRSKFKRSSYFQELVQTESYWKVLQKGLVSPSHDHRKICLSILKKTLLQIHTSFKIDIFEWDYAKKDDYLNEWSRYITLFEIMAIDTSLHQAEAGQNDIIALISPQSLIHPSWGFTLLSTGFRAGTEAVRKFTLQLLLSIPEDSLCLIKYALPIFEEIFMPYALLASHFIVRGDSCPYGDMLVDFIASIIQNLNDDEEIKLVTYSIFKVMVTSRQGYDPSKIYLALGLWNGLGDSQVLAFRQHDKLLTALMESESEGEVYHTTLQTIHLNLILNFKLDNLEAFTTLLDRFIRFNGASLLNKEIVKFKQYFWTNGFDDSVLLTFFKKCHSEDKKVLMLPFFADISVPCETLQPDVALFAALLRSGLDVSQFLSDKHLQKWFKSSLKIALSESHPVQIYESMSQAQTIEGYGVDIFPFWHSIVQEVEADDEETLRKVTFKFAIFNKLLQASRLTKKELKVAFGVDEITNFKKALFVNQRKAVIQSKDFYKVAEEVNGEFYLLLHILATREVFESEDLPHILKLLVADLSNFTSNVSIAKTSLLFFNGFTLPESLLEEWAAILLQLWSNLESSRLQLNQKDLHVTLIQCLLHRQILKAAQSNKELSGRVVKLCKSVVANAPGRKCLLPAMSAAVSEFQMSETEAFEASEWVPEILVEAFTTYQLKTNSFKSEIVIGDIFDEYFGNIEGGLYLSVYGQQEVSAQINLMAIFNSVKSEHFAASLFSYIIENEEAYHFFKVVKSTDGLEEWTRVRLLMIMVSIIDRLDQDSLRSNYLNVFTKLLGTDPSPLARVYIEWIVALILNNSPEASSEIFTSLTEMLNQKEAKPTLVCAYERLLFLMIQQLPFEQEVKYITRLLSILLTSATSKKAMIRHFSLSLICSVYLEIEKKKLRLAADALQMAKQMYDSAIHSQSYNEHRSGDALLWDIKTDLSLVCIAGGLLMRVSDHEVEYISQEEYEKYLSPEQKKFLNHPVDENRKELWLKQRKLNARKSTFKNSTTKALAQSPLQTKSGAWNTVMDIDDIARGVDVVRSDLIVVASLVDKPPNLGGICRLCDVLGAGLLTLDDIKVKTHPQFKNVAVTADQWMPMQEVKIEDIASFLREKKKEGYTLIGLEQTDKSVELNSDLKFPQKSLILLGKEREGIPGDLLVELDFCVEIKQVGVIRSMNIQTATAIIVHAYSSQHC